MGLIENLDINPLGNVSSSAQTDGPTRFAPSEMPVTDGTLNRVTDQVGETATNPLPGDRQAVAEPFWQNFLGGRRLMAFVNNEAAQKPPEASVSRDGDRVIIDAGGGDDQIGVTQDATNGSVTVTVNGERHTFTGNDANNITIKAGDGNDVIEVGEGVTVNLRLEGDAGNDEITGGAGNDIVEGGAGDDRLRGGGGRDYMNGSFGDDRVYGGDGNDVMYGGDGQDLLLGQDGNDYLEGSRGNDQVYGNSGDDIVSGGVDDDYVSGGDGNDKLYAGQGRDRLYNREGNDTIYAQTGDDEVLAGDEGGHTNVVVNVELTGTPGSRSVRVEGSPEFLERVEADIEFLRSSPTGRQMLGAFDQAYDDSRSSRADWVWPFNVGANDGNTVVIRETTGGNSANAFGNDVWGNPATGARGGGADGLINYNVRDNTLYGNDPADPNDDWNDAPPSVILYHEMAHDYNYVTGSLAPGEYHGVDAVDDGMNNRERQAVGLPIDHDRDPSTPEQTVVGHPHELTENGIRDELGLERRPNYNNPKWVP